MCTLLYKNIQWTSNNFYKVPETQGHVKLVTLYLNRLWCIRHCPRCTATRAPGIILGILKAQQLGAVRQVKISMRTNITKTSIGLFQSP